MGSGGHGNGLQVCCSKRDASLWCAHFPFASKGEISVLERSWVPVAQARLQGPHAVHSLSTQSTSQLCTLQVWVSEPGPQASPPLSGFTTTLRDLCWTPPPHSFVHFPNSDHSVCSQLIGHGKLLHPLVRSKAGHPAPNDSFATTFRVMFWIPPAQEGCGSSPSLAPSHKTWSTHSTEHSCGIQSVTTQSWISVGPYTSENLAISPRTVCVPQIFVNKISCKTALHSPITSSYSFVNMSFDAWLSVCSSVWAFSAPVASESSTFFWLLIPCHMLISPLCRSEVALHSASFAAITAVSSSTASFTSPHIRAMLSVSNPQSGFPRTHLFFASSSVGSDLGGVTTGGSVGFMISERDGSSLAAIGGASSFAPASGTCLLLTRAFNPIAAIFFDFASMISEYSCFEALSRPG